MKYSEQIANKTPLLALPRPLPRAFCSLSTYLQRLCKLTGAKSENIPTHAGQGRGVLSSTNTLQLFSRAHPRSQQGTPNNTTHTRDVVGYEGLYKITIDGRVWSIKNKRWLTNFKRDDRGWLAVTLSRQGKATIHKPHRLVAVAYVPNPHNKPHVNHVDGNKQNNHASNLEWVTHQENTDHAKANGLMWFQKGRYTA